MEGENLVKHHDTFRVVCQLHELLFSVRNTKQLKRFDTNLKWELLFMIYIHECDNDWGIGEYVNAISTSPQSNSTMGAFLRNLIDEEALHITDSYKKTKKHLTLNDSLRDELDSMVRCMNMIFDKGSAVDEFKFKRFQHAH